jgi:hypothetical protein
VKLANLLLIADGAEMVGLERRLELAAVFSFIPSFSLAEPPFDRQDFSRRLRLGVRPHCPPAHVSIATHAVLLHLALGDHRPWPQAQPLRRLPHVVAFDPHVAAPRRVRLRSSHVPVTFDVAYVPRAGAAERQAPAS